MQHACMHACVFACIFACVVASGHGCDNMTVVLVDVSQKLREKEATAARVVLYGGGEDLYLGQDEAEFDAEDED